MLYMCLILQYMHDLLFCFNFPDSPTPLTLFLPRWCFGVALWQMFHDAQLPMQHITDAMLVEQLGKSRDDWYKPHLAVVNSNEFLTAMLENTIQYCLRTDVVGV